MRAVRLRSTAFLVAAAFLAGTPVWGATVRDHDCCAGRPDLAAAAVLCHGPAPRPAAAATLSPLPAAAAFCEMDHTGLRPAGRGVAASLVAAPLATAAATGVAAERPAVSPASAYAAAGPPPFLAVTKLLL